MAPRNILAVLFDHPGIGPGRELGEAVHLGKGLLGLAHECSRVTGSVLDEAAVRGAEFPFHRYNDMIQDVPPLIDQTLETMYLSNVRARE